MLCDILAAATT